MSEFNNLKNFCDFITNGSALVANSFENAQQYDASEAKRLYAEHLYNLMLEADVDETVALCLAADIADKFHEAYSE